MKKLCTLFALLTMAVFSVTARQVDISAAKQAGQHFLTSRSIPDNSAKRLAPPLTLAYTAASKAQGVQAAQSTAYFYIFNAPSGFVIVAGDDVAAPILGYSTEGSFNPNNIPINAAKWFEGYVQQIRYAINHNAQATPAVKSEWQNLLKGAPKASTAGAKAVEPLVKTKWDQSPYYNDLCPYDSAYKEKTVTGCVATAMAQVMKFWNYPPKGTGFYSYNHEKYGTLSANFGNTTYNWAAMPDEVKDTNIAVATLMSHCGISIDMNYNVGAKGGSGASTLDVTEALKKYFGYSNEAEGLHRKNFTDSAWIATLKAELDSERPIQYAGTGTGGGHSFVCDGYDENNKFHFNWGWGGNSDGYFSVDALNPGDLGTGGGDGGFNSNQRAIIRIHPPTEAPTVAMRLSDMLTVSSSTLNLGDAFTVSANVMNSSTNPFTGDIGAAVFDNTGRFVDFVEIKTGLTLESGAAFPENPVFSSAGMEDMLPGEYVVRIYFRPTEGNNEGNWSIVDDYINFSNYAEIKVVKQGDLELSNPMTVNPANFIKGNPASVALKVKNTGTTEFTGEIGVGLFNLDGDLVEVIEEKSGSIPEGEESALTFLSDAIAADPGTYYVACLFQRTDGELEIVGSSAHPNPITVTVALPELKPDLFEDNNTPEMATVMPFEFADNSSLINTKGANCHEGTDYDFYKINLPAGYTYAIQPRLHDSYNSGNDNNYSLDAIFSYSTDNGSTWSDVYDDTTDAAVLTSGGTSVLFYVSPYFTGETGTYLLDLSLTRSEISSVKEHGISDAVSLYPNPAAGEVSVDVQGMPKNIRRIEIVSLQGQTAAALDSPAAAGGVVKLSTLGLANGIYALRLHTSEGVFSKKLVIQQ